MSIQLCVGLGLQAQSCGYLVHAVPLRPAAGPMSPLCGCSPQDVEVLSAWDWFSTDPERVCRECVSAGEALLDLSPLPADLRCRRLRLQRALKRSAASADRRLLARRPPSSVSDEPDQHQRRARC